jgi:hypothetical protein
MLKLQCTILLVNVSDSFQGGFRRPRYSPISRRKCPVLCQKAHGLGVNLGTDSENGRVEGWKPVAPVEFEGSGIVPDDQKDVKLRRNDGAVNVVANLWWQP